MNNREKDTVEESMQPGILPVLDDGCLGKIASFMDVAESALVSKQFLAVSGTAAKSLLSSVIANHAVDDDFRTRLVTKVSSGLERPDETMIHPRLLSLCMDRIPLKQRSTRLNGPSAVLPNGNIVTVCSEPDNMIRILDTQTMTIVGVAELGFVPVISGPPINHMMGPISFITDDLLYSNGYMVLHRRAFMADTEFIHVWKLEGLTDLQFLYTKALSASDDDAAIQNVAVAAGDSTMYLLWRSKQGNREVSYTIKSLAIATGETRNSKTIRMPEPDDANASMPRRTTVHLIVTGSHLLMIRHLEEEGPFPSIGLGIYTFCRFTLSQIDFSPCFEDGEIHVNHDRSRRASHCILYDECSAFCKKISFNGATGRVSLEDGFMCPSRVLLSTPKSVFASEDHGGFLVLVEYDLESGKKLRTLETGVPGRDHEVSCILSNHERGELFVAISGGLGDRHFVQTFLLSSVH